MGIAAMIIGIVALLIGFIPLFGMVGLLPAVVGLALGIVDVVLKGKKQLPRGMSVAGVVLNVVAIGVIVLWTMVLVGGATAVVTAVADANSASLNSAKGIVLNRAYVHAATQRGQTARAEFLEFWNNSNKEATSFKGTMTLYDRSNPERVDSSSEVTCQTPIAANAKVWLMRMYVNGALQQSAESDDRSMLEQYAKNMGITLISIAVQKHSFETSQVAFAQ